MLAEMRCLSSTKAPRVNVGSRFRKLAPCRRRLALHLRASRVTTPLKLSSLDANYERTHGFSSFSNWIIPSHFMVGRYPYVEPGELKKCRTHDEGEAQLQKILEAGIRTFVCLQNDMPVGGDKGFLPYKQPVELILAAMAGPPPKETFEGIRNPFVDRFLPKTAKSQKVDEAVTEATKCAFVHHPIEGMKTLKAEDLMLVLDDLEKRLTEGEKVYIHCWGGRGRAGTVACCLLAKIFGLPAKECTERVARAFDTRKDESYPSALSDEQTAFVEKFVQTL